MKRTHKELFILLLSFSIIFSSCIGAFFAMPYNVYAAEQWEDVTQDDLVTAFRYYCKSRNLTIDGSIADALTSFTTSTFNNICNTLGIDINSLQTNLKKTVEGNLGLRFLFNQQGVLAYNRIFAEFLQNNDLSVGDEVENKQLYSGEYFIDDDGNGCFLTVHLNNNNTASNNDIKLGTPYIYTGEQAFSLTNNGRSGTSFISHINGNNYTVFLTVFSSAYDRVNISSNSSANSGQVIYRTNYYNGFVNIIRAGTTYYIGGYYHNDFGNTYEFKNSRGIINLGDLSDDIQNSDIYITTNNNTINNNDYSNNYTIIYNDGDYYGDDNEPDPSTSPDGGGGGGDYPSDPDVPGYDPYPDEGGPTTPGTTTTGSDGVLKLPDLGFEFPEIDWSLKNIGDKFPFCIPGDIVSVLTLLNASPEAPKLQATIPIPHVYDWEIDIDFSEYDRYAFIIRSVEFLGFVISLIYLTIRMVKG